MQIKRKFQFIVEEKVYRMVLLLVEKNTFVKNNILIKCA